MQQRCFSLVAFLVAILSVAADCQLACAQAGGGKSTLRFISAPTGTAPAEGSSYRAPAQGAPQLVQPAGYEEPQELLPQGPVEHIQPQPMPPASPQQSQQPQLNEQTASQVPSVHTPATKAPQPTARRSPVVIPSSVRQANYNAPANNNSLVHTASNHAPSMVNVYAGANAQATLSQLPRPAPVQQRTVGQPLHQRGKPFTSMQTTSPVSPYLNMYRNDANGSLLPNYFAYVQPQLQQQEAAHQQAAEIQKLQKQVQNLSQGGSGAEPNSASMTAHAHYMDTGQFFRSSRHTP